MQYPKEGYRRFYHAGHASFPITEIRPYDVVSNDVFGGLFALSSPGAYGDGTVYYMDVPEEKILTTFEMVYGEEGGAAVDALNRVMGPFESEEDFEIAYTAVVEDRSDKVPDEDLMRVFDEPSRGEAAWAAQRVRGQLASRMGYQAVEMSDENGTSYLVLPGVEVHRMPRENPDETRELVAALEETYGVRLDISHDSRNRMLTLSRIVVPPERRGEGVGTQVMEDLHRYADQRGLSIALTPSAAFGGSKARLVRFYRSLGYKPNKGRNKDYSTRETMIRTPQSPRKNPARARNVGCKALGNLVQAVAGSNEAFELLDKEELDSFQTGGCAVLAAAVEQAFGLTQATVSSDVNDAEHIVNYCEGGFIDSDGWQTKEQLFEKLDMESSSPRRWRVRRGAAAHGFVCPRYLVEEVAALLEEHAPRKNPARARRSEQRKIEKHSVDEFGEEWTDVNYEWIDYPPFLTEGHFDLPMVKEAARIASRAKESKQLGRGHFGEAFVVETSKGPVIVKVAAERMLYQDRRPWTREEQQANLMHEAGVANELEDMGYTVVPRSVYVELEDGTPAIVREYGEEVEPRELSGREFYDLERALISLEQDTGWRVQDELLLLRRPDGSLFIGDVGIWAAPDAGRRREWRLADSHLPGLLNNLGERLFGQRFSSLARVQQLRERLEERDQDDVFSKIFREDLAEALASREAVGIPSSEN